MWVRSRSIRARWDSLAVIGSLVGVLLTALPPGHRPWPLVGLIAGGLLGWCWPPLSARAGADRERRRVPAMRADQEVSGGAGSSRAADGGPGLVAVSRHWTRMRASWFQ